MLSPEIQQMLISFLVNIGTFAATELKERWELSRKGKPNVDISSEGADQNALSSFLDEYMKSRKDEDVKRTLELVQRKEKLIYDARRAKLSDEDQFNQGLIAASMLELRKERHEKQIKEKLDEIEADLKSLGIQFERKSA